MVDTALVAEAARIALNPSGYLIGKLVERVVGVEITQEEIDKTPIAELEIEARKQELAIAMASAQAKVAQELAIAKRIEHAEEVEIEEFYDVSGEGGVGLKSQPDSVTLGLSGSGKKVTRRVIKFRSFSTASNQIPECEV